MGIKEEFAPKESNNISLILFSMCLDIFSSAVGAWKCESGLGGAVSLQRRRAAPIARADSIPGCWGALARHPRGERNSRLGQLRRSLGVIVPDREW